MRCDGQQLLYTDPIFTRDIFLKVSGRLNPSASPQKPTKADR